jgi:hypothetical protein
VCVRVGEVQQGMVSASASSGTTWSKEEWSFFRRRSRRRRGPRDGGHNLAGEGRSTENGGAREEAGMN